MWPFNSSPKTKGDTRVSPDALRAIWNIYSDEWPKNNDRYECWKPASILPAPKWLLKRAVKLGYAEWPEPIDWTVFSAFHTQFVDLALHLSPEKYEVTERFRQRRVRCAGEVSKHGPLVAFSLSSSLAATYPSEQCARDIVRMRDGLRRSPAWDPVGADDDELEDVHQIVLESTAEFATLIQEWRFYILSIGRDRYTTKT